MEASRLAYRRLEAVIAVALYVGMIFSLAMLPGTHRTQWDEIPRFAQALQNVLHIPLYAGLAWVLTHAVRDAHGSLSAPGTAGVVLAALVIAVSDEWIQSHTPRRTAGLLDVGLDLVGVLSVTIVVWLRSRRTRRAQAVFSPQADGPVGTEIRPE